MEKQKGFCLTQPGASRIHSWSLPCICSDCLISEVLTVKYSEDYLSWSIHFYAIQSSGDTSSHLSSISFSLPGRSIESWFIIAAVADIVPVYFMLLGSRSQEGSDELNVGFQESVLFGLGDLFKGRGKSLCCCLASQCKIFLLLSSPAVSIGPVGSRAAVCHCCLDHVDMVNCTSGGPGSHEVLYHLSGGGLPFRPAMGSTSGPCRWVGNLRSSGPSPGEGQHACSSSWLDGKGLCF